MTQLISISGLVVQHLLALFLIVAGPVWDYYGTRKLRASASSTLRLGYYRRTMLWLWVGTATSLWTPGWNSMFTVRGIGIDTAWLNMHHAAWWTAAVLLTLLIAVQLVLPVVQVTVKYRHRPFLEPRQFEQLRFFLPATWLERRWYAALSVSAGFCEELLFRGFLLHYLHTWPLHLAMWWAAPAAALIFGAHHLYQGRAGFLSTTVGGLVFTAMLLITGSLLPGMLYHALVDLSLLLYWRPTTLSSSLQNR